MRSAALVACLCGFSTSAIGQSDEVVIDLSGVTLADPFDDIVRDSVNSAAAGSDTAINPALGYRFAIEGDLTFFSFDGPIFSGTIAMLFDLLQEGQSGLLTGYVRNIDGVLTDGETLWAESFDAPFLGGFTVRIDLEIKLDSAGVVTFAVRNVDLPFGDLFGLGFTFDSGTATIETWSPSTPQPTEWHFDGDLDPEAASNGSALRFMDDAAFGTILGGIGAEETPDPTTPTGVTESQTSFVDTSMDPGVPAPGGVDDVVLKTSPAFNLSDPGDSDLRRGIGLALFPEGKPEYPGSFLGQWSMVWDMLIPAESWFEDFPTNTQPRDFLVALLQDDHNNGEGADFWIRYQGGNPVLIYAIDGLDFTSGAVVLPIQPDEWFRLALVVDEFQAATSRVYVNGTFLGETGSDWLYNNLDPRDGMRVFADGEAIPDADWNAWGQFPSLWASSSGTINMEAGPAAITSTACLFADLAFGGSQPVLLANMLFIDALLTDSEITGFGGPSGEGILFLRQPPCPAERDGNPGLGFFDLVDFLTDFALGDPSADLDPPGGDGVFSFFDLIAYLTLFAAGCP